MIKIRTLLLALGCVVISHIAYAGIYWLPSYVGENNGLGYGKRTNDSDPIPRHPVRLMVMLTVAAHT